MTPSPSESKRLPRKPQFARRRRPRVGEVGIHVVPADSEGFGNGVDVEQQTNEHRIDDAGE